MPISVFFAFAFSIFRISHLFVLHMRRFLEAMDNRLTWQNEFMTRNSSCAVFFQEYVIIDILECEIFE